MGFVLSVLYFAIYYLTPAYLLGPLADAHVEVILAALILVVSLPAFLKTFLTKTPQTLAIAGLAAAVFMSRLIGTHWIGGGFKSFLDFIPNALSYFLVCLHCTSKKRMQILVFMMLIVCLVVIVHGYIDLRHGTAEGAPPPGVGLGMPTEPGATASPYLLRQMNSQGEWTFRLQGLGEINDPNDFGQLMVCLVPLLFISWKPKSPLGNIAFVILPVCALVFGIFLTHSRGSLISLTTMAIVAGRRKIGTMPALILGGCLFAGAMALQFTGGRDISASAGEDRTSLWGQGMDVFKTHPVFGVGFGSLWEYTDAYLTAHNSIIVCAAELGFFGFYFWSLYLFSTMRDALALSSPEAVNPYQPPPVEETPFPMSAKPQEELDKEEINRLGRLMFLSLTGFLVAGWFLSRAFVVTLFLIGGMAESVYQMALNRGMISPRLPFFRVLRYSAGVAVCLLTVMYVLVRVLNYIH